FCFIVNITSERYTPSLHDALPISREKDNGSEEKSTFTGTLQRASAGERKHGEVNGRWSRSLAPTGDNSPQAAMGAPITACGELRSEEHTSELQSRFDLVCRLLLEK